MVSFGHTLKILLIDIHMFDITAFLRRLSSFKISIYSTNQEYSFLGHTVIQQKCLVKVLGAFSLSVLKLQNTLRSVYIMEKRVVLLIM